MNTCLFVSDLHGKMSRYEALLKIIRKEKPDFVFIGGDLLPHKEAIQSVDPSKSSFISDFLFRKFKKLKDKMECNYPEIFLIPGNDDHKLVFDTLFEGEKDDLWRIIHNHCIVTGKYSFYGYACVPPTPFRIKDWERYDISKDLGPGCLAPADGYHSTPPHFDPENATIESEIIKLTNDDGLEFGIFLFHSPPYNTAFDQAEISEGIVLPVGSKAIRNFIEEKKPYITLHGHIHESVRISGEWKQSFGRTFSFSAAHDGPELSVIKFELHDPHSASRRLIKA